MQYEKISDVEFKKIESVPQETVFNVDELKIKKQNAEKQIEVYTENLERTTTEINSKIGEQEIIISSVDAELAEAEKLGIEI